MCYAIVSWKARLICCFVSSTHHWIFGHQVIKIFSPDWLTKHGDNGKYVYRAFHLNTLNKYVPIYWAKRVATFFAPCSLLPQWVRTKELFAKRFTSIQWSKWTRMECRILCSGQIRAKHTFHSCIMQCVRATVRKSGFYWSSIDTESNCAWKKDKLPYIEQSSDKTKNWSIPIQFDKRNKCFNDNVFTLYLNKLIFATFERSRRFSALFCVHFSFEFHFYWNGLKRLIFERCYRWNYFIGWFFVGNFLYHSSYKCITMHHYLQNVVEYKLSGLFPCWNIT